MHWVSPQPLGAAVLDPRDTSWVSRPSSVPFTNRGSVSPSVRHDGHRTGGSDLWVMPTPDSVGSSLPLMQPTSQLCPTKEDNPFQALLMKRQEK